MMPSCVPATHVDDNGCILTAGKMKGYLEHPRILGLGEVMDAPSVINGSVAMHEKLQLFQDRVKDGHAPFLAPGDLAAYVLGGIDTDHECVDYEYAMAEARNGMQVLIREGSAARNLDAIVKGLWNTIQIRQVSASVLMISILQKSVKRGISIIM